MNTNTKPHLPIFANRSVIKQLKLKFANSYKRQFGGELLIGRRKSQRPLSLKKPIHVVLRSNSVKLFKPHNTSLEKLIYQTAGQFKIRIYNLALNWNHIHSIVMIKDRKDYVRFIRALTSLIAQRIRAKLGDLKQIFILRPWSRILEWGRDFKRTQDYVYLNQLEAFGYVKRKKSQVPS